MACSPRCVGTTCGSAGSGTASRPASAWRRWHSPAREPAMMDSSTPTTRCTTQSATAATGLRIPGQRLCTARATQEQHHHTTRRRHADRLPPHRARHRLRRRLSLRHPRTAPRRNPTTSINKTVKGRRARQAKVQSAMPTRDRHRGPVPFPQTHNRRPRAPFDGSHGIPDVEPRRAGRSSRRRCVAQWPLAAWSPPIGDVRA